MEFEIEHLKEFAKTQDDLLNVDLTNNEYISYDDIYHLYDGYNILLDIKRKIPYILFEASDEEFDEKIEEVDKEELIIAAGLNPDPNILKFLLSRIDYIPNDDYHKSALYFFNSQYPSSHAAITLYRYNDDIEYTETNRNNIIVIKRFIEHNDYSFSIYMFDFVFDDEVILIETILTNALYPEDIDFILKCMSMKNKKINDIIFGNHVSSLFDSNTYKEIEDYKNILNNNYEIELSSNSRIWQVIPYDYLLYHPTEDEHVIDNAILNALKNKDKEIALELIKMSESYPKALSYAMHHDIYIPVCRVSKEDVLLYPNLISVYHVQGDSFDFDELKTMEELFDIKYVDFIIHLSTDELQGIIELMITSENVYDKVDYRWLIVLAEKTGLCEISDWGIKFKNKKVILNVLREEMEISDAEQNE